MQFLVLALFAIAWLLLVIGGIMLIIAAFRVSVVWGLCVLFLGPAALFFLMMHWEEAKRAFGIQMLGMILAVAAIFSGFGSTASGLGMETLSKKLAESGLAEEHIEALQQLAEDGDDATPVNTRQQIAGKKAKSIDPKDPQTLVGKPLTEVKKVLGRPKGQMKCGHEVCYLYEKISVFSADGRSVSHVESGD